MIVNKQQKDFYAAKDRIRERLIRFTIKAFQMLPSMNRPFILDVGCGSGVPTMELAKLSDGYITALDINQDFLDELAIKIEREGLFNRITIIKRSIFNMDFPEGSFDIIWAEGSIWIIGFEKGLRTWRRFLKQNGFLVVHDARDDIDKKLNQITRCGYDLLGYFELNEDVWRNEYFLPIQKLIDATRENCNNNPDMLAFLKKEQKDADVFTTDPASCCSVFFIIKKR